MKDGKVAISPAQLAALTGTKPLLPKVTQPEAMALPKSLALTEEDLSGKKAGEQQSHPRASAIGCGQTPTPRSTSTCFKSTTSTHDSSQNVVLPTTCNHPSPKISGEVLSQDNNTTHSLLNACANIVSISKGEPSNKKCSEAQRQEAMARTVLWEAKDVGKARSKQARSSTVGKLKLYTNKELKASKSKQAKDKELAASNEQQEEHMKGKEVCLFLDVFSVC